MNELESYNTTELCLIYYHKNMNYGQWKARHLNPYTCDQQVVLRQAYFIPNYAAALWG